MTRPNRWKASLSRRMTLLFGGAVVVIVVVTLVFPTVMMRAQNDNALRLQASRVAQIGYDHLLDVGGSDWQEPQRLLAERWPLYKKGLGLDCEAPRLLTVEQIELLKSVSGQGFLHDAVAYLRTHPTETTYPDLKGDGETFRLAMAVRATATDPRPGELLGVVDVALPVPAELRAQRVWILVVTGLSGAAGVAVAALIFYLVTQRLVLSPVNALRRVAEQVTRGDLTVRADLHTGDEFQQLGQAFDDMLTHLYNVNRSLDVRLGELGEKNVALYEANRVKSEFLANVSHELRTPLASIIGFAELSRDLWDSPQPDAKRGRRYAGNILVSGRALLEIINDLLDLAKMEAGRMQLHRSVFSPADVCRDSVDFIRPQADKKNIDLQLTVAGELPPMDSDAGKLKQILYNLLSNAVKFTPAEGKVAVEAAADGDGYVHLSVRDSGPGIDPAKFALVFEKFHQLDASKTREFEGTGLGLAITRELTHFLGGSIGVDSTPGHGATFTVRLPVKAPG
ncbi:MAG: sensor histidine kinase [Phycisphaerales bacterium]|nr:MAG: sensor histidine kinase [Phycisphaerales bacterium]